MRRKMSVWAFLFTSITEHTVSTDSIQRQSERDTNQSIGRLGVMNGPFDNLNSGLQG